MTKLLALLLALVALGCSGSDLDQGLSGSLATYSCDWQASDDATMASEAGLCWSSPDPDMALTPRWVDNPCDVGEFRLARAAPGQEVRVWTRIWTTQGYRRVQLVSEHRENCQ